MHSDSDLDEFEESKGDAPQMKRGQDSSHMQNKPYDEAYEVSQDLSMAESYDGREGKQPDREKKLRNDKYDEAMEVSQSMDQSAMMDRGGAGAVNQRNTNTIANRPFDEEHELSQSYSEESVDTVLKREAKSGMSGGGAKGVPSANEVARKSDASAPSKSIGTLDASPQKLAQAQSKLDASGESSDDEGDHEESYIEGAYTPSDYEHLNVSAEVRDLFQYIERYKPQEIDLASTLKCFIPEYIPTIGEMDPFLKVPRPDGKPDDSGLKYLDEPSATQSDPTVLELQLRAMTKKVQYGDVVVRSIEDAAKNPSAIDRWIQNIQDLHRTKPPPQVHYKRNMPDSETLMDVWPEEFEAMLANLALPSPDLDLSLAEYAKILCSMLDIPTYDNPIESLHLMFSLYMDFKNNPHFQQNVAVPIAGNMEFGGADVMEINQGLK